MEELFQIIFGFIALAAIIALAIVVTILIVTFGLFIGSIIAIINYYKAFTQNIYIEKLEDIDLDREYQPALKSYFFRKWYIDLKNVILITWDANLESASCPPSWMNIDDGIISAALHLITFMTIMLFGTITLFITSVVHIIVMLFIEGMYFLFFSILRIFESLYLSYHKFFVSCPVCYEKYELPVFHCYNCHAAHTKLIPGQYGILNRTCMCGSKLPTSFLNGRNSLQKSCVFCESILSDEVIAKTNRAFPIIGLTNAGKSTFLFALVSMLKENSFMRLGNTSKENFEKMGQIVKQGEYLLKTVDNKPMAFNLIDTSHKKESMIHLYDHAGEIYNKVEQMKELAYYNYLSGIFFIIDTSTVTNNNDLSKVLDLMEKLRETLAQALKINNEHKIPLPIAIIFNRLDIKNIDIKGIEKNSSLQSLFDMIDNNFAKYKFFQCSSTGDNYKENFNPYGVIEPYNWLNNS